MQRRLLSFAVAVGLAAALWAATARAYNRYLAAATEPLLRMDRRYAGAQLKAVEQKIAVQSPRKNFPPMELPADQLSYNVILLAGLFTSNPAPFRDRNMRGFAIGLLILALTHPIGAFIAIEATFASRMGAWSETNYGDFAANAWVLAELFYRLVGMFGIVFACWFMALPPSAFRLPPSRGNV